MLLQTVLMLEHHVQLFTLISYEEIAFQLRFSLTQGEALTRQLLRKCICIGRYSGRSLEKYGVSSSCDAER